ncbi:MAG: ribosome biogenesis GTPase Der [Gammaproteobacteria bacterium]|jgi:GTP-binding protein|nr:MAG: ribosome biogenesis GTPase Der [Gammaproteobacteria bacterium]
MTITIAILGRPNVGKSTLFNRLTGTRAAIVLDSPGVTRDRQYGAFSHAERHILLIDTGGLHDADTGNESLEEQVSGQSIRAATEADAVFWIVDGRAGINAADEALAQELRPLCPRLYLLVNKVEGLDPHLATADFHRLGVGEPIAISGQRGSGTEALLDQVCREIPDHPEDDIGPAEGLPITFIGRPNVGKSTLINRILGEERLLTSAEPGTTRDSISIPFRRQGRDYRLIDTAGVRRRARVTDAIEKFSVVKTLAAMDAAAAIIVVLDATEAVTEQDISLIGMTVELGKALVIAVNKWDGLDPYQRKRIRDQLERKLDFVSHACLHFISARHGTGVGKLFESIEKIRQVQSREYKSSQLTEFLERALMEHSPPLVRGRRIKLRYAHLGGHNPLRIVIHGNQTEFLPEAYQRYLANYFRQRLRLTGTPVLISLKTGDNPFKGRRNELTPRQIVKRKRMLRHTGKRS